jgi:hypothetical protein
MHPFLLIILRSQVAGCRAQVVGPGWHQCSELPLLSTPHSKYCNLLSSVVRGISITCCWGEHSDPKSSASGWHAALSTGIMPGTCAPRYGCCCITLKRYRRRPGSEDELPWTTYGTTDSLGPQSQNRMLVSIDAKTGTNEDTSWWPKRRDNAPIVDWLGPAAAWMPS